jgi:hypothetical protein
VIDAYQLPAAELRGSRWERWMSGPAHVTSDLAAWAASLALVNALFHAMYFATLALDGVRGLGLFVVLLALTIGIQWTVTCAAMAPVAALGLWLRRWPRPLARAIGAIVTVLVAMLIERVAAGAYLSFTDDDWGRGFWAIAIVLGAAWGLWLPVTGIRRF